MRYIDMHCDTLFRCVADHEQQMHHLPDSMVDIHRLRTADALLQFFAVFVPLRLSDGSLEELPDFKDEELYFEAAHALLEHTVETAPEELEWVLNRETLLKLPDTGKLGVLLTIEDGRVLNGRLQRLLDFYARGVRLITLTWNHENCIGYPNSENPAVMEAGLTDFGREAVLMMNDLGMLVDVSHLSDGGVRDVLRISKKPVVASHSCSRFLNPHPRNISDELLFELAQKGGIVGLNFSPTFLPECPQTGGISRISDMVLHLKHMLDVGGEDCVAIGSDFDGLMGTSEISSPLEMEQLFEALVAAGVSERVVEKIAWKNAYRVLQDVLQ
jgi:membrane dipeptidase